MVDIAKTLEALDFNAIHCGDVVAKAYFGLAAEAIRVLDGEASHWRRMEAVTAGKLRQAKHDARLLEDQLRALSIIEAPCVRLTPLNEEGIISG